MSYLLKKIITIGFLISLLTTVAFGEVVKNVKKVNRMNKLTYAKKVAEKYWVTDGNGPNVGRGNKTKITKIEMIEDSKYEIYLKEILGFSLLLYNPISVIAGRSQVPYTLFLEGEAPFFIGNNDDELIKFFSNKGNILPKSKNEVQIFLEMFAKLRSYEIAPDKYKKQFSDMDWATLINEKNGSWEIEITLLTDSEAISISRYKFIITKKGIITFEVLGGKALRHYS